MRIKNYNNATNMYLRRFNEILYTMNKNMLEAKISENEDISRYFIACMIPHHKAAIYMCQNLLNYTNYAPLISIANNIITTQTEGVEEMRNIYNNAKVCPNTKEAITCYTNEYLVIVKDMVKRMKNSPKTININYDFVTEMIPHHEGAIAMCKNLLKYNIDNSLKEVANSIILEQSRGVEELKRLIEQ